jgi:hypothetical protein
MQHLIAGTDFENNVREIVVDKEGNIVVMDYLHNKVHVGEMLFISKVYLNVANGATVYIRHVSGPTKYLHSEVIIETVGQWEFTSYSGTTYTANGTIIPIINRKSDSTYVPEVVFRHTPTPLVLGTVRLNFVFGGGTNPSKSISGSFSERLESVFAPNSDVLVGVTNQSGSNQYVTFTYNFYEE